ncbi:MAG TPA: DUF998 domain-containing protein [Nitrososphaerales archaeon]|nr:DUF998 domain-containing protein [Nitrososphaerales archaeon]
MKPGKTEASAQLSRAKLELARRRRFEAMSGISFLAGAAQFLLVNTVAQSLYAGYSVSNQTLGELGVGQTALLWNVSLLLLGAAVILGGYFALRSLGRRLTSSLAFVLGAASIGAAAVPLNLSADVHWWFTFVAFASGGLLAVTSYRVVASKWMRIFSIILGGYSLVAFVLYITATYLGIGVGGMERMVAIPIMLWLSIFSGFLLHTVPGEYLDRELLR